VAHWEYRQTFHQSDVYPPVRLSVCLSVYLSGCVAWSQQVWSEWSVLDRRAALVQPRWDRTSSCPNQRPEGTDLSPARRPVPSINQSINQSVNKVCDAQLQTMSTLTVKCQVTGLNDMSNKQSQHYCRTDAREMLLKYLPNCSYNNTTSVQISLQPMYQWCLTAVITLNYRAAYSDVMRCHCHERCHL